MSIYNDFKSNLDRIKSNIRKDVWGEKVVPHDPDRFINHMKIIFPYFCLHSQDIIDELKTLKEDALNSIINELYGETYHIPSKIRRSLVKNLTDDEKALFLSYYRENEDKFELRDSFLFFLSQIFLCVSKKPEKRS